MGYETEFTGSFQLSHPLQQKHLSYLQAFSETRRVMRSEFALGKVPDRVREDAGLPLGRDGGYYVGHWGKHSLDISSDVIDYNNPPHGQPGLWCHWEPSKDGKEIQWNKVTKFYYYAEWLQYLIDHFLNAWDYELNGCVEWRGEENGDFGVIEANGSKINGSKITVRNKCKATLTVNKARVTMVNVPKNNSKVMVTVTKKVEIGKPSLLGNIFGLFGDNRAKSLNDYHRMDS